MLPSINGLFRLTRDAELRYSNGSTAILKLGLACSEKYGEKETQLFIDATVFGKMAETLNQWAGSKGTQLYIRGKLRTEMWTDQQGQKQSKISMVIEGFDFVGKRVSNAHANQSYPQQEEYQPDASMQESYQGQGGTPQYQAPASQQQQQQPNGGQQQMKYEPQQSIPEYDIDEDEIPFKGGR